MNIFAWIAIAYMGINAIASVSLIGKPRKPFTHGTVITYIVIQVVLITLIVLAVTS